MVCFRISSDLTVSFVKGTSFAIAPAMTVIKKTGVEQKTWLMCQWSAGD